MVPQSQHHHGGQCNICLDNMTKTPSFNKKGKGKCCFREGNKVVRLSCGHAYHSECMDGQLSSGTSTCPDCRTPISQRDIQFIGKRLKKNYVQRNAQDVAREVMNQEQQNSDRTSRENLSLWNCDAGLANDQPFHQSLRFPGNLYRRTSPG